MKVAMSATGTVQVFQCVEKLPHDEIGLDNAQFLSVLFEFAKCLTGVVRADIERLRR